MNFSNDGLQLWTDTPDAPAPSAVDARRDGSTVTVGVRPASPANAVNVRYRVDGGPVLTVPARALRTDYARDVQHFVATFPRFMRGDRVEYVPVLSSGGRQAPAPGAERMAGAFVLEKPPHPAPVAAPPAAVFTPKTTFLARVTAQLAPGEIIGVCPEGYRINWHIEGGTVVGPQLRGVVRPRGTDSMVIRRDGVGIAHVRAVVETDTGAVLQADYEGYFELGENGYENAIKGIFPEAPPLVLAPRFSTANEAAAWVNRTQFIGVGHVVMAQRQVQYDLYAVGVASL